MSAPLCMACGRPIRIAVPRWEHYDEASGDAVALRHPVQRPVVVPLSRTRDWPPQAGDLQLLFAQAQRDSGFEREATTADGTTFTERLWDSQVAWSLFRERLVAMMPPAGK